MSEPKIFIGIGAQKAGSSWLYRYLQSHPEVHFRALKELHYFNAIEGGGRDDFIKRLMSKRAKCTRNAVKRADVVAEIDGLLEDFHTVASKSQTGHSAYLQHLARNRGDKPVIGEVTPAYATCSEESFRTIAGIGPNLRMVFVMRDPLDRLWSHLRMLARKSNIKTGKSRSAEEFLEDFLAGKARSVAVRSDYSRTLTVLGRTIPPKCLHVAFYEELFNVEAVRRITDFIGISSHPANFDEIPNVGQVVEFKQENRSKAMKLLRPQYDAVESHLGRLPDAWRNTLKEVA